MFSRILDIAAIVSLVVALTGMFKQRAALELANENVEGLKTARALDIEQCAHDIAEVKAIAEHASREASAARSDVVRAVAEAATQATIEANRSILTSAASALAAGQKEIIDRLDEIQHHVAP